MKMTGYQRISTPTIGQRLVSIFANGTRVARQLGRNEHRIEPVNMIVVDNPGAGFRQMLQPRHLDLEHEANEKSEHRAQDVTPDRNAAWPDHRRLL